MKASAAPATRRSGTNSRRRPGGVAKSVPKAGSATRKSPLGKEKLKTSAPTKAPLSRGSKKPPPNKASPQKASPQRQKAASMTPKAKPAESGKAAARPLEGPLRHPEKKPSPAILPPGLGFSAPLQAAAPQAMVHAALGETGPERSAVVSRATNPRAEEFAQGDHVVYPTHGVGKVERIAIEDIAGHRLELIHITFEENRMTLRVPVSKARSAGLRKLATRKTFEEALAVLKGRARIKRTMWSRRAQEYEAKINSGDPLAIAEVVRDLHRNAGQPDQSFSERQIYEAAMDRLAAELAALDQTDKPTAAVKLATHLQAL